MSEEIYYDIIIPHYGVDEELNQTAIECIKSIKKYSDHYRIIFIDNASPAGYISDTEGVFPKGSVIVKPEENLGFVKAVNVGLQLSHAPFIVIMNNDTLAVENWLDRLSRPFYMDQNIGAVGPRTTTRESWQGKKKIKPEGYVILPTHSMLAFFCVMLRKSVIDKVGVLSQDYGVGLGDDDDYCYRLQKVGYRLCLDTELIIPHKHRTTFKKLYTKQELEDMRDNAMDILREKGHWPKKS